LPQVLRQLDEPLGDPSILPTYLVANVARPHITVALGGDGSDELFAGYDTFRALRLARVYDCVVPRFLHPGLRALAGLLPHSARNMTCDFNLRRPLRGLSFPRPYWPPAWLGALEPAEIEELTGAPVDLEDLYSEALELWDSSLSTDLVDRALEFYTCLWLPD